MSKSITVTWFVVALALGSGAVGFLFAADDGVRMPGAVAAPAAAPHLRIAPPAPVPIRPRNGDTVFTVTPTFEVESPVPAPWFHFRVMEEKSVAAEGFSPAPYWNPVAVGKELQRGHRYHWSCRVRDFTGWSPWFSPECEFTVGYNLPAPEPKLPQDGSTVATLRPLFLVKPVSGSVVYRFRVWDGKTLKAEGVSSHPMWLYEGEPLVWANRYDWRCRVETPDDSSGWFEPAWSFETATIPATDGVIEGEGFSLPVARPEPNPFRDAVRLQFAARALSEARIYDASGRCIRSVSFGGVNAARGDRCFTFVWDGRDQRNRVVGPGAYFCQVVGQSRRETFTLVKAD